MASLGTGVLADLPTPIATGTYSPFGGGSLGTATLVDFSGGATVDPRRYLNIGGTAVPIS